MQIVLDEAAFLLDLASIDGTWDDSMERIAECYDKAGLPADLSSTETEHQVITFVVTE